MERLDKMSGSRTDQDGNVNTESVSPRSARVTSRKEQTRSSPYCLRPRNGERSKTSKTILPVKNVKLQNTDTASTSHELQPREVKTNFKDDDDFCLLYLETCCLTEFAAPGSLKEETIAQLSKDHPGIFDGLDDPDDLFEAHPVKYQPLAQLISKTDNINSILNSNGYRAPGWCTQHMTYGMYKGGFYRLCDEDCRRRYGMVVHEDHYRKTKENIQLIKENNQLIKGNNFFVPQLRQLLFDESRTAEYKIRSLKMAFPPLQDGEEDITTNELSENINMLCGVDFKNSSTTSYR